ADNPIDLGGRKVPEEIEIAGDAARIIFSDEAVSYGLAILTSMPFFARRTRLIGEAAQALDKPMMIALTPGRAADAPRRALGEIGQFHFDGIEDALRALALVVEHDRLRDAPPIAAARPSG